MTQVDHSTFTPQQLSVEKLIKEQNFTWKVRYHAAALELRSPYCCYGPAEIPGFRVSFLPYLTSLHAAVGP